VCVVADATVVGELQDSPPSVDFVNWMTGLVATKTQYITPPGVTTK
jgi:hypothetical protein